MIDVEKLEFGLDTFGDMQNDDAGNRISAGQTIRNVVEQAVFPHRSWANPIDFC